MYASPPSWFFCQPCSLVHNRIPLYIIRIEALQPRLFIRRFKKRESKATGKKESYSPLLHIEHKVPGSQAGCRSWTDFKPRTKQLFPTALAFIIPEDSVCILSGTDIAKISSHSTTPIGAAAVFCRKAKKSPLPFLSPSPEPPCLSHLPNRAFHA